MNDPAKETPKQPAPHKPAKADYRSDQVRRYMRRHGGKAIFYNADVLKSVDGITKNLDPQATITLEDLPSFKVKEIASYFNQARAKGFNQ